MNNNLHIYIDISFIILEVGLTSLAAHKPIHFMNYLSGKPNNLTATVIACERVLCSWLRLTAALICFYSIGKL